MAETDMGTVTDNNIEDASPAGAPAAAPNGEGVPIVGTPAPSGGPEGQNEARELVAREELDKVIRERQAAKQRARAAEAQVTQLKERLAQLEGEPDGAASPDVGNVAADNAAAPPDERGNAAAQNVAANSAATAPNHAATAPDAPAADDAGLRQKLAARESQLAAVLRDERLRAAAQGAGAVNADQVVALLRQRVRMVEQPDGQFAPRFFDEQGRAATDEAGTPVEADAFVRGFLSRSENANLVRAGFVAGSGARVGGSADVLPLTLSDFHALPPSQRRQVALRLSRRQRESLLGMGGEGVGYL
jgi:hypothetical protein